MMHLIATLLSCFVAANAWPTGNMMGSNMMGSNMMSSNPMQNSWGNGMYGGNMNNMPGQQNWDRNNGQMWSQNGNQNNWAQQNWGSGQGHQYGQTGNQQQGQQGMNNNILHLLLGSMLANNMKSGQQQQWQQPWQQQQQQEQQQQWSQWHQEKNMKDMEDLEEMMKKKMMKEIADLVTYQMELKEKETAYMNAVKFLCMMVNATHTYAKKNNESVYNTISDEDMTKYEGELHEMNDLEKFDWLLKKKSEGDAVYGELFFRTSIWNCETAHEYKMAVAKWEKMENQEDCGGSGSGMEDIRNMGGIGGM